MRRPRRRSRALPCASTSLFDSRTGLRKTPQGGDARTAGGGGGQQPRERRAAEEEIINWPQAGTPGLAPGVFFGYNASMKFDFDQPVERAGTWSTRWDRYAGRDVIPLWVADSDFRAPPVVLEALAERLRHGVLGYTAPPEDLRVAIVERLERLYRWRIDPAAIVFLPGVIAGLHHAARMLV